MDTGDTLDTDTGPDTTAEFLTAEEAARVLGVSARQVRRYGVSGTLRATRRHGQTRYQAGEVAQLATARGLGEAGAAPADTRDISPDTPDAVDATDTPTPADMDSADRPPRPCATGAAEPPDATEAPNASGTAAPTPEEGPNAGALAVEALGAALHAAQGEIGRPTDALSDAQREAGLWEGRARTLDERLRQIERAALPSGQAYVPRAGVRQDGQQGDEQRTATRGSTRDEGGLLARLTTFVRRFPHHGDHGG